MPSPSHLSFFASPSVRRVTRWTRISTATLISISLHLLAALGLYTATRLVLTSDSAENPAHASTQIFTAQLASQTSKKDSKRFAIEEKLAQINETPAIAIAIANKNMQPFLDQPLSLAPVNINRSVTNIANNRTQSNDRNLLPPAPDYRSSIGLDPPPRPLQDIQPEYPEDGDLQVGTVVLRLLISDQGLLDDVAVVRSSPAGIFENAAVAAFRAAKFSPGKLLGTPVKSQMTVEIEFTPIHGAAAAGRGY